MVEREATIRVEMEAQHAAAANSPGDRWGQEAIHSRPVAPRPDKRYRAQVDREVRDGVKGV